MAVTTPDGSTVHTSLGQGWGRSFDMKWVIIGLCIVVVAWLALIPLGFLDLAEFRVDAPRRRFLRYLR